jgi:release factor glutamine methyltransferase
MELRKPKAIKDLLQVSSEYLKEKGIPNPRLNAEVLLAHQLKVDRVKLYVRFDQPLTEAEISGYRTLIRRRLHREPLQYITGTQEFWCLEFLVSPHVLIPRPETELLVEQAISRITAHGRSGGDPVKVLDLGTGSGAIAVSIAGERPEAEVWATDVSSEALKMAGINAEKHGVRERIQFRLGDLWEAFNHDEVLFDVILSNPPYIAAEDYAELPPEVREHEPRVALDGHQGGTYFIEKIVQGAISHMKPGGWLMVEMAPGQTEEALKLIGQTKGYVEKDRLEDFSRRFRVVVARKGP